MSSLVLNKYSPLDHEIKKEFGDKSSPLWLLVNSKYPMDTRNIWMPIFEVIQDKVFRELHQRIDREKLFIKYASSDTGIIPRIWRVSQVTEEIEILREGLLKYQPKILVTLGTVAYELGRRVSAKMSSIDSKYWSTANLDDEFERSIDDFDINKTNQIPLIRKVIRDSKCIEDDNFSVWEEHENYFHYVGTKIAERIIENKDYLNIWIN